MARPLMLFAAAASLAALATPSVAQSAGDAGLRYLSWPGRPAQTAIRPSSADAYGLRGEAEITLAGGAPSVRRPDRYSGGGDGQSLEARYYQRRQAQSGAVRPEEPRYEEPRPEPRPEPSYEQPRYEAPPQPRPDPRDQARYDAPPPRLTQPTFQPRPEPLPEQRREERPEPRYAPQQPAAQTTPSQPPSSGYAPQAQPEQQAQPTSDPRTGPATASDSVRYYSIHRQAGRQPDPIEQTYVSAEDAMVALSPASGTSLAERQRQATAEETALDLIRQLPPDQLALLLDTPQ